MKRASELPKTVDRPSEDQLYGLMVSLFNFIVVDNGWETDVDAKQELARQLNDWMESDFGVARIDFES